MNTAENHSPADKRDERAATEAAEKRLLKKRENAVMVPITADPENSAAADRFSGNGARRVQASTVVELIRKLDLWRKPRQLDQKEREVPVLMPTLGCAAADSASSRQRCRLLRSNLAPAFYPAKLSLSTPALPAASKSAGRGR